MACKGAFNSSGNITCNSWFGSEPCLGGHVWKEPPKSPVKCTLLAVVAAASQLIELTSAQFCGFRHEVSRPQALNFGHWSKIHSLRVAPRTGPCAPCYGRLAGMLYNLQLCF